MRTSFFVDCVVFFEHYTSYLFDASEFYAFNYSFLLRYIQTHIRRETLHTSMHYTIELLMVAAHIERKNRVNQIVLF